MYGVREESKKGRIDISPSILFDKMLEKQEINRKCATHLDNKEVLIRKKTVDWLCETGESLHITSESIHKAVVYLDVIMSENTIVESDLQPLGLVCLLIAAKMSEKDRPVAQIKSLLMKQMSILPTQIRRYEMQVLSLLRWDLQCVTPMDFVQFFVQQGILFTNDRVLSSTGPKLPSSKLALTARQYAEFFADMCLQEYAFLSTTSLHLAASVLAAARKMLKTENIWSPQLAMMTGVQYTEISKTVEQIFKIYNKLFAKGKLGSMKTDKENCPSKTGRLGSKSRNDSGLTHGAIRYV